MKEMSNILFQFVSIYAAKLNLTSICDIMNNAMFSLQLKELRQQRNLSQKELAKILNVSTGTVGNWEAGSREPDFTMTLKIADYFDVSLDTLLGRERRERIVGNEPLTATEYKMLTAFRELGENGQLTVISMTELLSKHLKP